MEQKEKRQTLWYLKDNAGKLPFKAYKDKEGNIFIIYLRRYKKEPDPIRISPTPFCAMLEPGTDYQNIGVSDVSVIAQRNDLFDSEIIKQFALWAKLQTEAEKLEINIEIERKLDQLNNGKPTELATLMQGVLKISCDLRNLINGSTAFRENYLRYLKAFARTDPELREKMEYWVYALEREPIPKTEV